MSMMQPPVPRILPNDVELSNTIRKYLVDTARWLRNAILSDVLGLGNRDTIVQRLYQSADQLGIFFAQYYGDQIGNEVREIYQSYYRHIQSMIQAYLAGNTEAIEQLRADMYEDADNFAAILSRVNRYLDYATLQALLYVLVDSAENQIAGIVEGDYDKEVAAYDQYIEQIYNISDEITYGIIRQFRVLR